MKSEGQRSTFDVIVVGAGHAGCEAALACARMGQRTLMLTTDLASVAMMPCNPAIGGTGKGHLVREIDALGGEMGLNIDKTLIQSRMLNKSKGPAVQSLRAQADKAAYQQAMAEVIHRQDGLELRQGEAVELLVCRTKNSDVREANYTSPNTDIKARGKQPSCVQGVRLADGSVLSASAVILCTGTFLGGKTFIGSDVRSSGPQGLAPATALAENLKSLGLPLRRFKTGTPARALSSSLDYSRMEEQAGDEPIVPFSFLNDSIEREQVSCYLTYTNEETHRIIRENFDRSALFGGQIEGVGPRYCPSIEDKVKRFADRKRHQLFVEPEGKNTDEVYLQGMSTSLPLDVQEEFYATIAGLEHLTIVRPGYAIEYDCIDPTALLPTLEYRGIKGLYCAGQFNGSSGYEEAGAQGLMAGINCALKLQGKEPLILKRDEAYIGVLIDDLVLKGTNEPYRIMTSRAEYRVLLRQDNADVRLTEKGYEAGLVTEERYRKYRVKKARAEAEMRRLRDTTLLPSEVNAFLSAHGMPPAKNKVSLAELLKRPGMTYAALAPVDPERPPLSRHEIAQAEVEIKYEGYIDKQLRQIAKFERLEERRLPEDMDYLSLKGLRREAAQKLAELRPATLGMASRISGVSPADVQVLLIHLERRGAGKDKDSAKETAR